MPKIFLPFRRGALSIFLFLTFGPAMFGAGVSPQDKGQTTLQYDVSVTLKLIQVYVVDKEGKPVTDLRVGDFELWDGGKLMPLTEFEAHSLSVEAIADTPAPPAATVPPP